MDYKLNIGVNHTGSGYLMDVSIEENKTLEFGLHFKGTNNKKTDMGPNISFGESQVISYQFPTLQDAVKGMKIVDDSSMLTGRYNSSNISPRTLFALLPSGFDDGVESTFSFP